MNLNISKMEQFSKMQIECLEMMQGLIAYDKEESAKGKITPMYFIHDFTGKQKRKEMIDTLRKLLIDTDQSSKNNIHLQIEESAIAATSDIDMQSIGEKFEL